MRNAWLFVRTLFQHRHLYLAYHCQAKGNIGDCHQVASRLFGAVGNICGLVDVVVMVRVVETQLWTRRHPLYKKDSGSDAALLSPAIKLCIWTAEIL